MSVRVRARVRVRVRVRVSLTLTLTPKQEAQQERTEPPLATAARLHVQHGAVLSRELRA